MSKNKKTENKNDIISELRENTYNVKKAIASFIEQNSRTISALKSDITSYLRYIDEGRLIIIGGVAGLGKTAYCLQLLYELARDNDNVIGIYASAEMMIEELMMRLIVNQKIDKDINIKNVRKKFNKKFNKEIEKLINKAVRYLTNTNFYFLNASRFRLDNIIDLIKITREKNPDKRIFIVIDYLQLLIDTSNLSEVNVILKKLKDTLVEQKANAIVISALNRESIRNNNVDMSAFRDSSAIEYTSDIAILLTLKKEITKKNKREDKFVLKPSEDDFNQDVMEIYAFSVKNRIGRYFRDRLIFDKIQQRFELIQLENEEEEEPIEEEPAEEINNEDENKDIPEDEKAELQKFIKEMADKPASIDDLFENDENNDEDDLSFAL